jgi:hypothetical protein
MEDGWGKVKGCFTIRVFLISPLLDWGLIRKWSGAAGGSMEKCGMLKWKSSP